MDNRQLGCDNCDTLNDIVTCFLAEWERRTLLADNYSAGAVFRFLTENCGLSSSVQEKAYGNKIKRRLKNKEYTAFTLRFVSESFK